MENPSFKQAVAFITLGMLLISLNDLIIKKLSGAYPLHQMIFTRAFIGLFFSLIIVQFEGGFQILRTSRPGLHMVRGLMVFLSNMTYFAALAVLPLGHATALFFISPILITALSIPLLGETVGPRRIAAVIMGFVGVFIMMKPHTWRADDVNAFVFFLPVLAALFYALMQILTRKLSIGSKPSAMAVYIQMVFITLSLAIGLVAGGGQYMGLSDNPSLVFILRPWVWPPLGDMPYFAVLGVMSAGVGYSLSRAYSCAPAATVAPFEYVLLPLAILWGWSFFGDIPDMFILIGIVLIVGSGLYVYIREGQKRVARLSPSSGAQSRAP